MRNCFIFIRCRCFICLSFFITYFKTVSIFDKVSYKLIFCSALARLRAQNTVARPHRANTRPNVATAVIRVKGSSCFQSTCRFLSARSAPLEQCCGQVDPFGLEAVEQPRTNTAGLELSEGMAVLVHADLPEAEDLL